jgi:hypothetical protein
VGPELLALASSAATSPVAAMPTDGWPATRDRIVRLLGRGDQDAEQSVRESLGEDAAIVSRPWLLR